MSGTRRSRFAVLVTAVVVAVPAFILAVLVDTLGDVVKHEVRGLWRSGSHHSLPHSIPESIAIIAVCLALIGVLLWQLKRYTRLTEAEALEGIAVVGAFLLAPVSGIYEWLAGWVERLLH